MKFGTLTLSSNLFLSPLAGYTQLPFRKLVRELGGVGLCTTDLVNARSLLEGNRKALKLVESDATDRPMAVQLFGADPAEMRDAAVWVEQRGADSIDINMGCPVRKVCRVGGGSAMMTDLARSAHLVEGMVRAVGIPVTVKMRLGWDDGEWTAPDLARALEQAGVAAVFVHGRTRAQGFDGSVKLEGIRRVVQAVRSIPVIGNGDVTTPEAARRMMEVTGCAGVSVGRGAFYDPWIFRRTRHYLDTGELLPEPDFEERLRVMRRHLEYMVGFYGEESGCVQFRKVAPWYARRFGPASVFNRGVVQIRSVRDYERVVEAYREWRGHFCDPEGRLLPRHQLGPMAMNFDEGIPTTPSADPPSTRREAIPVPSGPVEWW